MKCPLYQGKTHITKDKFLQVLICFIPSSLIQRLGVEKQMADDKNTLILLVLFTKYNSQT